MSVAVGACADRPIRHLAPPPRAVDAAQSTAGPGPWAFSGAVAAPPDLAADTGRAGVSMGVDEADGRARPALPPGDWSAAGSASSEGLDGHSALTRLGAKVAPFSTRVDDTPTVAPAPAALELGREDANVGAGPTRTAMRVRPVTPPFSGPRPANSEPSRASPPVLARSEPPPVMPFVGARSAREVLRDAASPRSPAFVEPRVGEPTFARAPEPDFDHFAPPAPKTAPALPWDTGRIAGSAPVLASFAGEGRALDDPIFRSAGDAFATVIVSDRGVEVVAEEARPHEFRFAALPADPGGWAEDRSHADGAVQVDAAAGVDMAVPAGEVPSGEVPSGEMPSGQMPSGAMIATVLFDDGAVEFGEAERQILREVARIQQIDNRKVTLVGHASGRTRADNALTQRRTNMRISRLRAEAAGRALASFGVPRSRMNITPMGDTRPLYAEVMPAGEAGNRRVEVYLEE